MAFQRKLNETFEFLPRKLNKYLIANFKIRYKIFSTKKST